MHYRPHEKATAIAVCSTVGLSLTQTSTTLSVSPYQTYICSAVLSLSFLHAFHGNHHLDTMLNHRTHTVYACVYFHPILSLSIKSPVLLAGVSICWSHWSRVIWGHWWSRSSRSAQWDPIPTEESEHVAESQLARWVLMIFFSSLKEVTGQEYWRSDVEELFSEASGIQCVVIFILNLLQTAEKTNL